MNIFLVLPYYLSWHYGRAILDIKDNAKNFIVFVYNVFSIPVLISTLFSPWMRIKDGYSVNNLLETFVFNTMMRFFGVFVRLMFIILGILSLIFTTIVSCFTFIIWFFLPVFMVMIFVWSLGQFI
jgi:hypothetical protein